MSDKSFHPELNDLVHAMQLLMGSASVEPEEPKACAPESETLAAGSALSEPSAINRLDDLKRISLPEKGIGEIATLDYLAPMVLQGAAKLGSATAFAHMDPPTPWITWATSMWNARLNQNLLHPATSPFARAAELTVIDWLAPLYGMHGGHMCSGSTLANLTALWAARDAGGVDEIVASKDAHLSVGKAARILGVRYRQIETKSNGQINLKELGNVSNACLVLTAGTTSTGVIDPLNVNLNAKWLHVDAAWAGPLRLTAKYSNLLDGVERADSVSVSAHKWLFQPKESALVFFKNPDTANTAISYGADYIATPNIGVQGSRGAAAVSLLATLIAFGKEGICEQLESVMTMAMRLTSALENHRSIEIWAVPTTGVTVFRPTNISTDEMLEKLPSGTFSSCIIDENKWLRSVAANPLADIDNIIAAIESVLIDD